MRSSCTALIDSEIDERRRAHDLPPRRDDDRRRRDLAVPARRRSTMSASAAWARAISSVRIDRRGVDDARPAVHKSSGVQMHNGYDEWIWRPLQNPETLQISAFLDKDPKGFGLLQRERDFAAFQDDEQRFERRPSLWIEPIGEWGQGAVQLIEIPSECRDQRQHPGLLATEGPDDGGCRGRRSPIASSGAGIRPIGRTSRRSRRRGSGAARAGAGGASSSTSPARRSAAAPIAELKAGCDRRPGNDSRTANLALPGAQDAACRLRA